MMQVYFLSIAYMLLGVGMLLVDHSGGRLLLLIRIRKAFRSTKRMRIFVILLGFLLTVLLLVLPVPPGPMVLGDLVPALTVLALTIWFLSQSIEISSKSKVVPGFNEGVQDEDSLDEDMLHYTGNFIEKNKTVFGYIVLTVAVLHFLVPMSVLL